VSIDLDQIVELCNRGPAKPGERPSFVLEVPGIRTQRRFQIHLGPAVLDGKVIGVRNAGTKTDPKRVTGVRFFVDEVTRELQRKGLASPRPTGEGA
jgi:hypothetical protein